MSEEHLYENFDAEPDEVIAKNTVLKPSWWGLLLIGILAILMGWYFFTSSDETGNTNKSAEKPGVLTQHNTLEEKPQIANIDPANFLPNPYLDNHIDKEVPDEAYSVKMDKSATAEKITLNGNVAKLRLKGSLKSDVALAEAASFVLMIYSNKQEDYLEDRSLLNVSINLQPLTDNAFPFQFNANLRITPGLYYYIIVEKSNDELLYVGRFEVTPT